MDVTGKVTDSTGEPLTGANIYISDASGKVLNPPTGGTADVDGKYKLKANIGDYITASFVGMAKKTSKVGSTLERDFVLAPSVETSFHEVEIVANKVKPKAKVPTWLMVFGSLAFLLVIVGGTIQYNESK